MHNVTGDRQTDETNNRSYEQPLVQSGKHVGGVCKLTN